MADPKKEFLAERDYRIFQMRRAGTAVPEIAKRLGITVSAVNAAIRRQLEKMNREMFLGHPEVLRMELERLDQLQAAIWPMTQHRMVKMPDGTQVTVEPDPKFVQQAREIIRDRIKLLGLEQTTININQDQEAVRSSLAGVEKPLEISTHDPKAEVIKLLEIMGQSGILPQETVNELLGKPSEEVEHVRNRELGAPSEEIEVREH